MGLSTLTASFPWSRYSKKLAAKIEKTHNAGSFDRDASEQRGMRLVVGSAGKASEGNVVVFFWLVDKEDGSIVDAKFQVLGQSALIGAAEIACDILVGKNYDQARRITADLIDKQARDRPNIPAFPPETAPHLNLVLEAIDNTADQCTDIPLPSSYAAPPAPADIGEIVEGGYPGWTDLSKEQKLHVLEDVLNEDIRPYIALDGGGVEIIDLSPQNEVLIAYHGNCTSCYSSVGATLSYIQHVLRAKINPSLVVVPDLSSSPFAAGH